MLRATLEDAAVAAAKAWSHPEVEPRHVIHAICRTLANRMELKAIRESAKAALNPRGSALNTPIMTPAAQGVLAACSSEDAAVEAALKGTGAVSGSTMSAPLPATESKEDSDHLAKTAPVAKEDTATVLAELDALVGLATVKAKVRQTIAVVQANCERSKAGLPGVTPGLHLVFTGPPGTGKTTVARLVARLYASTGALTGSKVVEVTKGDLVAGYVGQTALKTQSVIERTKPGVLFIDEAYSLAVRHESDFSNECISTLVKNMEDHRSEFAVIAAGYTEQMGDFIKSNPGLRSRFKTFIDFPDYSPAEMLQIFAGFARDAQTTLAPGVLERAEEILTAACSAPDFGNARFARSLWEQAYASMALRAAADGVLTLEELRELIPGDLPAEPRDSGKRQRRIGFVPTADRGQQR